MAGSSSAKWEQELKKLSGDIEDVLRNMPESARTRAVEDLTSVLNDLRQKLPGAGGVEGEETTDDEGGGEGAGQGEAKRRRVEHGQGAAAVSGSPEGGARDEGKEGNSAENNGESADAGGERGDADGGQQRVSEDDGAVGG